MRLEMCATCQLPGVDIAPVHISMLIKNPIIMMILNDNSDKKYWFSEINNVIAHLTSC